MSKVVTANMLATGRVVFLGPNGAWVENVDDAVSYESEDVEDGLALAQRDQERALIVDPFVTNRECGRDGQTAMTLRDSIRAFGPTIRFRPEKSGGPEQAVGPRRD